MSKSAFSIVGLVHKLLLAAEEQGYTPELINTLAEKPELFKQLLQVQQGHAEFKQIEHIINCDANPFIPNGWEVEEHQKSGQFRWNKDAQKDALWLAKGQQNGKVLEGNKLRKELVNKPVLNANVLDYLLANPHLVPEEWKCKAVFFWGTIYRDSRGFLCVRYLCWSDDAWDWSSRWLVFDWDGHNPAALRAS